jgi:hypothetical protein
MTIYKYCLIETILVANVLRKVKKANKKDKEAQK